MKAEKGIIDNGKVRVPEWDEAHSFEYSPDAFDTNIISPDESFPENAPEDLICYSNSPDQYFWTIQNGRYGIVKQIGAGGMSRILLAHDSKMEAEVVVKEMMLPMCMPDKVDYYKKRFLSEARLLFNLSHHGIPRVIDYYAEFDMYYLVMEYIDGKNLDQVASERPDRRITIEEFVNWMKQLLETLDYLHNLETPVIHRDIKPSNIMINSSGRAILLDFGIARSLSSDDITDTKIGSMGFASPEHFHGKCSVASDIYGLGATFHMLLTGENPWERFPFEFPSVSKYRSDAGVWVDYIVSRMLDKNDKTRYQSAAEVLQDLNYLVDDMKGTSQQNQDFPESGEWDLFPEILSPKSTSQGNYRDIYSPDTENRWIAEKESDKSKNRYPNKIKTMSLGRTGSIKIEYAVILILFAVIISFSAARWDGGELAGDLKAKAMAEKAQDLFNTGRYNEAYQMLSSAIELNPENLDYLKMRALISVKLHKSEALADLYRIIVMDPANAEAYWQRSRIFFENGDYNSAEKDLDILITLDPRQPKYYLLRSDIYRFNGDYDRAINDLSMYLRYEQSRTGVETAENKLVEIVRLQKKGNLHDYSDRKAENIRKTIADKYMVIEYLGLHKQ